MKIAFQYTGQLANAAGFSEEAVELEPGTTLQGAIERLAKTHGLEFAKLVMTETGELRASLLVVLDGEQAEGDRASLKLDGTQTVMLMPPIAGG